MVALRQAPRLRREVGGFVAIHREVDVLKFITSFACLAFGAPPGSRRDNPMRGIEGIPPTSGTDLRSA